MQSTTRYEPSLTQAREGVERSSSDPKLLERYEALTKGNKVSWTGHHHMLRLLGRGGQGEVYLTESGYGWFYRAGRDEDFFTRKIR